MSLVRFLVPMAFHEMARSARAAEAAPTRVVKKQKQHKLDKHTVESNLEHGERAAAFMETLYGREKAVDLLAKVARRASGSQPSPAADATVVDLTGADDPGCGGDNGARRILPYGFWRKFMEDDLIQAYSARKRIQFYRALVFYALRKLTGASTLAAMRGMRDRNSCRDNGGASNAEKGIGLGFNLLQFFVDHLARLMSRNDSCLLMAKAREMRADLVLKGHDEDDLPNLEDNAGHCWFRRWRLRYGIVKKVTGMKLKVPWGKVKRRVKVFLGNIFRLRAFWEILYPGTELRFLSLDQKPSWFNNAGHTGTFAKKGGGQPTVKEIFAHTRQRYTIFTGVPSWGHGGKDNPPKMAVLFKATPHGTVIKGLLESDRAPPWMKVQVQENGSYRSGDVVEALEWMLPDAKTAAESIVVMLDWYSGHLTPEVLEVISRKGHVLMFHGGGCTPFTQINDTHLHSTLSRLLIQYENDWAHRERCQFISDGEDNKVPTMTREEILSIVDAAWRSIDHAHVAQKGYKQTGPAMPLRGPVAVEDVYADLLKVMEQLDNSGTALEVGTTLRDNAVAFVKAEYEAGRLKTWADCQNLIEEHDCLEEAAAEGMEAFGASPDPYDDAGGDGHDDKSGDEDGGGDADGDGGGGELLDGDDDALALAIDDDDDDDDDDCHVLGDHAVDAYLGPDGACAVALGGSGIACSSVGVMTPSHEESNPDIKIAAARKTLFDEAVRLGDDRMVRSMRKEMRAATRGQREASTNIGKQLMQQAKDQRAADVKRRRTNLEEKRLANKTAEETKLAIAEKHKQTEEARLERLRLQIVVRRDQEKAKQAALLHKEQQRWLQTQFPVILAERCFLCMDGCTKKAKEKWQTDIEDLLNCGPTFERQLLVKNLWDTDEHLTRVWATIPGLVGGARKQVKMGIHFQELLEKDAPPTMFVKDPVNSLERIFKRCVPCAGRIFKGNYSPFRMLHQNDYVVEKAFVYGILALSKWLGPKTFIYGIYGKWPPPFPEGLLPSTRGSTSLHLTDLLDKDDAPPVTAQLAWLDEEFARRKSVAAAASSSS